MLQHRNETPLRRCRLLDLCDQLGALAAAARPARTFEDRPHEAPLLRRDSRLPPLQCLERLLRLPRFHLDAFVRDDLVDHARPGHLVLSGRHTLFVAFTNASSLAAAAPESIVSPASTTPPRKSSTAPHAINAAP